MLGKLRSRSREVWKLYSEHGVRTVLMRVFKKFTGGSGYLEFLPREFSSMSREARFEYLYETKHWQQSDPESVSGAGSSLDYTRNYRPQLVEQLEKLGVRTLFDAPCGDFNWMSLVVAEADLSYVGGDIVLPLVEENRRKFTGFEFIHFDITKDSFGHADLWHCRDCLFHLSHEDVLMALENFCDSEIEYAMLTTHPLAESQQNKDIVSGDFRYLDLMKAPFFLGPPLDLLMDYHEGVDAPRFVGVWRREQILRALRK